MASAREQGHAGALAAFRIARRRYLAGEMVNAGALADELGVDRTTLFRWVGSRDSLLVEVIWSLTEPTLRARWRDLAMRPGPRVPALLADYLRATIRHPGASKIACEHNARLMRLLTYTDKGFHPRLVAEVRRYLELDLASGRVLTALSVDELAAACVRITESYYYLPTVAGQPPDPDGAERVLTELLTPKAHPRTTHTDGG